MDGYIYYNSSLVMDGYTYYNSSLVMDGYTYYNSSLVMDGYTYYNSSLVMDMDIPTIIGNVKIACVDITNMHIIAACSTSLISSIIMMGGDSGTKKAAISNTRVEWDGW